MRRHLLQRSHCTQFSGTAASSSASMLLLDSSVPGACVGMGMEASMPPRLRPIPKALRSKSKDRSKQVEGDASCTQDLRRPG